jgi:hypothetical protein
MSQFEQTRNRHFGRPTLESLEERLTPSAYQLIATFPGAAPTGSFLNGLYRNVLDRNPNSTGSAYWTLQLNSGVSKGTVAAAFWESTEHRKLELNTFYGQLLHRAVDPGAMSYWLDQFQNGATEVTIMTDIVLSNEFTGGSSSANVFVDNLYQNVLGRSPDADAAQWIAALQNGQSKLGVAQSFLMGSEAISDVVDTYYENLLQREPSSNELQGWVSSITNGLNNDQAAAIAFIASAEYSALFSG